MFFSLYSLGLQPFDCLNRRLKVEMLGKPAFMATSVIDMPDCSKSSSAT